MTEFHFWGTVAVLTALAMLAWASRTRGHDR
jgi:hypothetical protein